MRLRGILLVRHPVADMRPTENQRGARVGFGFLNRRVDGVHVVAILHAQNLPLKGFKPLGAVFRKCDGGIPLDGNVVVIIKINQLPEAQMPRQRRGFGGDAFHQVAVGDNGIDKMADDFMPRTIENRREVGFRNCHAHAVGKSLPKRTGRRLYARGQSVFRMSRRETAPLTKTLEFLHREVVAREVEQRVEQRGAMSARENKSVAVHPARVGRVVPQMSSPNGVCHRRRAHRQPRMPGARGLHHIGGKKTNGIEMCLDGVFHDCLFFV